MPHNYTISGILAVAAVAGFALAATPAFAQGSSGSRVQPQEQEEGQSQGGDASQAIDVATAKALNTAIEALNMEKYAEAQAAIGTLNLEKLSPYERSKVEQILFNISYNQEKYDEARQHLQRSIDAGGLNEQEISQARYQFAQLYMTEEKWKEGAAALEEWFETAMDPNSAAYYLLAVAYYQMEDFARALPHAQKAIELTEKPQESWLQLLLALYLQKEQFNDAIPLLVQLVETAPDKKTYWMQLSAVYGQVEDYPNALGVMQLAYDAGLVTEDAEIRRLADLLLFNDVPYRGGQILEDAIEKGAVNVDDKALREACELLGSGGRDRQGDRAAATRRRPRELGGHVDPSRRGPPRAQGLGSCQISDRARHEQRRAQGCRRGATADGYRVLQRTEARRCASLVRARPEGGEASSDSRDLSADHRRYRPRRAA